MKLKPLILFVTILSIITAVGCAAPTKEILPTQLSLEESIKQIIISKGENYDFLGDEIYMDHMDNLATDLVNNKSANPPHFAIGNLDGDNIPELAIFQERNPEDIKDEGYLELYKFNGEKYEILDRVPMNYDNSNYQIVIGKISENQDGILLNNSVGARSGVTYGYIIKDNKLVSILDEQKMSLISVSTENMIKDIDNDGILEFSIYTVDPETEDANLKDSDKMTLWYKWNGKDSGVLVDVERKDYTEEPTNKEVFEQGETLIESNFEESLLFLENHKDELSKYHNTQLLQKYISVLDEMSFDKGIEINNLFIDYQKDDNHNYLLEKYSLSFEKFIENLNNAEYLKREKVLKDEEKIKSHLLQHLNLGYKLRSSEGMYYYIIDYQKFVDKFSKNITKEYKDYLKILALNTNEPYMSDGRLTISMEKLAERILVVDSFRMVYPYSDLLSEVKYIYDLYINRYFYGDLHVPTYDEESSRIKDEVLEEFHKAIEKYSYTNFADTVSYFLDLLEENNFTINDDLRHKFDNWLN